MQKFVGLQLAIAMCCLCRVNEEKATNRDLGGGELSTCTFAFECSAILAEQH